MSRMHVAVPQKGWFHDPRMTWALFSEQWPVMTINRQVAAGTSVPLSDMGTDITERQKLTGHFLSLCDFLQTQKY
jgi:hypothetical protein